MGKELRTCSSCRGGQTPSQPEPKQSQLLFPCSNTRLSQTQIQGFPSPDSGWGLSGVPGIFTTDDMETEIPSLVCLQALQGGFQGEELVSLLRIPPVVMICDRHNPSLIRFGGMC